MPFARVAVPAPLLPLDRLLDYQIPAGMEEEVREGSLVEVPFGRQKTWALVFEITQTSDFDPSKLKAITRAKLPVPIFSRERLRFLRWLSKYYFFPLGEVCESAIASAVREGTARTLKWDAITQSEAPDLKVVEARYELNEEQLRAVDTLAQSKGPSLLWGVTGSGKTEVYLKLIERKLRENKSALVLVPEIALTPQLTDRFEKRFPNQVAIFHSALRPTQIRKAWLETLAGKKRIAVGARSALFAPLKDLGVIILDEEHDSSYKQEERLRYHARDSALELGRMYKAPVVLGSATPSAETLNEVLNKRMGVLRLNKRAVGEAALPTLEIVDLKKGLAQENKSPGTFKGETGSEGFFEEPRVRGDFFLSPELRGALESVLEKQQQAILFLNRRGLGSQELCRHCGHVMDCPNCDVKLTPHFKALLCHYCAYEIRTPKQCPECAAHDDPFLRIGIGTEAVEEAVKFHLPKARIARLDRDTTATVGSMDEIVEDFRNKKADILIGTQMVAKGHDFPEVTLVGILLAEMGLSVPDFRAFERNLQLLLQVSGRAGRALHPGRVILQTFQPDHPVFVALQSQRGLDDYGSFIEMEIEKRKLLLYPPSGRLVLMRFDGLDADSVSDGARAVATALKKIQGAPLQVLGPVVSPISKIRARHRYQVLVKSASHEALQKAVTWIFSGWESQKLEKKYRTRLTVDMDPMQML